MQEIREWIGIRIIKFGKKVSGNPPPPKTEKPPEGSVTDLVLAEEYQEAFEVKEILEKRTEWNIDCREKSNKIPEGLKKGRYKQNGYVEKTEVITFPIKGKPTYLHFYRRKWKDLDTGKIHTNQYQLHPKGMKATIGFGDFLKELTGPERREFFRAYPDIRIKEK